MLADKLFVVTGVSGSGKSTVLHAFKDLGYYSVENLPGAMIADFVRYFKQEHAQDNGVISGSPCCSEKESRDGVTATSSPSFAGYVLTLNTADPRWHVAAIEQLSRLREQGVKVIQLFIDCQDEVLMRRYQETRRPHPLFVARASVETMAQALCAEREHLQAFRSNADRIIDTSSYSPHELRRLIEGLLGAQQALQVEVVSFGYKFGVPRDADLVIDVRFLPNPHFETELRALTGEERSVDEFVFRSGEAQEFLEHYLRLLTFLLPRYLNEGKSYLIIAVGCTGGRHRSVAVSRHLAQAIKNLGYKVTNSHRDKDRL